MTKSVERSLVYSCHKGTNSEVFPEILRLHIPEGSTVADVTYGQGVFQTFFTDLKDGVDCRNLPYEDDSLDVVVFDPPYMHSPGGAAHTGHQNYEKYYRNNATPNSTGLKYHDAVLRLYFETFLEAKRVLHPKGLLVVKGQDQVCAGFMRMASVELAHFLIHNGFLLEDQFIVMSNNKPGVSRMNRQKHSRRNHSFFFVARKARIGKMAMSLSREIWPDA